MLLLGVAVGALVLRYRRADDGGRRQLLWLLLATCAVLVIIVPWGFVAGTPVAALFAIPLIPIAVTVAVVRHQLLDIRLVISRAVAWLLASVVVVAGYVALVVVLDEVVTAQVGRSAAATVVVALAVAPLLPRLQRRVDRAMYGDRGDPASVVSRIGAELLADPAGGLGGVVSAVRDGLRVPYAAVSTSEPAADGEHGPDGWTAVGDRPGRTGSVPLEHAGTRVGELVVGLRPGERSLSDSDRTTLALVAVPLAAAVYALRLSGELQASRERIVTAREEERRRLRRDLHDGLGPTLTGIALIATPRPTTSTTTPPAPATCSRRCGPTPAPSSPRCGASWRTCGRPPSTSSGCSVPCGNVPSRCAGERTGRPSRSASTCPTRHPRCPPPSRPPATTSPPRR